MDSDARSQSPHVTELTVATNSFLAEDSGGALAPGVAGKRYLTGKVKRTRAVIPVDCTPGPLVTDGAGAPLPGKSSQQAAEVRARGTSPHVSERGNGRCGFWEPPSVPSSYAWRAVGENKRGRPRPHHRSTLVGPLNPGSVPLTPHQR